MSELFTANICFHFGGQSEKVSQNQFSKQLQFGSLFFRRAIKCMKSLISLKPYLMRPLLKGFRDQSFVSQFVDSFFQFKHIYLRTKFFGPYINRSAKHGNSSIVSTIFETIRALYKSPCRSFRNMLRAFGWGHFRKNHQTRCYLRDVGIVAFRVPIVWGALNNSSNWPKAVWTSREKIPNCFILIGSNLGRIRNCKSCFFAPAMRAIMNKDGHGL